MNEDDRNSSARDENASDMSLLNEVLGATRQEDRSAEPHIIDTLVKDALKGTPSRSKDTTTKIHEAIHQVEREISAQLTLILHHPSFQELEASWRGLYELVKRSETDASLKIAVLSLGKGELFEDVSGDTHSQSSLQKKLSERLDTEEGEPFDVLIDAHELTGSPEDVTGLKDLSSITSSTHSLLIASASAGLVGLERWSDLDDDSSLGTGLSEEQVKAWKELQSSSAAQTMILALPRMLARMPYGASTSVVEEFAYEEIDTGASFVGLVPPSQLTWVSSAFLVGALINDSFVRAGRAGVNELLEQGARLGNLLSFLTRDEDGDPVVNGPLEVMLDRHRDSELRRLGFTPLQASRTGESVVINGFESPFQSSSEEA